MDLNVKTLTLCAKGDVAEGTAIKVEAGDLELAVYHVEGEFYVTDDVCTHGPGSLSEGYLDGHEIECDFHNGRFDIRDGKVTAPPCIMELKTYRVIPDDTMVVIDPS
ncbi:non-heme iron oxygenase ferredoxin subunit [Actibacterium sp. MT2.3-13A]|uniref:non-heme iron oxygenase ferredoxin subunit n=1 Tax=Actibacterium sp. MT2.3-13A TaxID=2828332 RepID=UPI001BA7367C|nr:non-heme iron oxygenase ferredoxin subunit [Actibacterium sp. MT2.3-13A]